MEGVMWGLKVSKYMQATFDVLPEIVDDNMNTVPTVVGQFLH
jgi:hypothetical protein